jgi:hypothetical protein
MKHRANIAAAVIATLVLALVACGASLSPAQAMQERQRLRAAMQQPVSTREQRDDQSRLLADVVNKGALQKMSMEDVRAAFGPGQACRLDLCSQHGFTENDWYYEIGVIEGDQVKQLPVLIVGFDPQGRAARIWTLTTD